MERIQSPDFDDDGDDDDDMKTYRGEELFQALLTSAVARGKGSVSRPGPFTPVKYSIPQYMLNRKSNRLQG
jgi:hypothetical protein